MTEEEKELRLLLVGTVQSGKSSTGNTILGLEKFKTKLCGNAFTKEVSRKQNVRNNKTIVVVDTPGIFDMDNDRHVNDIYKGFETGMQLLSPGPHAIILVCSMLGFSMTDMKLIDYFRTKEKKMMDHMIVVFTGRDLLERGKNDFDSFKSQLPLRFQDFFINCVSARVFAFDNTKHDPQVDKLLELVDSMAKPTEEKFYNRT